MNTTPTDHPVPPLLVVPWIDHVADSIGLDPRSSYVERFWLPILGPTSVWLLRRFAVEFDTQPDGFSIDVVDCARSIGVGSRGGRNGPFHRSIERCIRYGIIHPQDHGIVAARTRLPPLERGLVRQLPRRLQNAHDRWRNEQRQRSRHPASEAHAARLARSLLDVGAEPDEIVAQLRRWNFDEPAANRALARATAAKADQAGPTAVRAGETLTD